MRFYSIFECIFRLRFMFWRRRPIYAWLTETDSLRFVRLFCGRSKKHHFKLRRLSKRHDFEADDDDVFLKCENNCKRCDKDTRMRNDKMQNDYNDRTKLPFKMKLTRIINWVTTFSKYVADDGDRIDSIQLGLTQIGIVSLCSLASLDDVSVARHLQSKQSKNATVESSGDNNLQPARNLIAVSPLWSAHKVFAKHVFTQPTTTKLCRHSILASNYERADGRRLCDDKFMILRHKSTFCHSNLRRAMICCVWLLRLEPPIVRSITIEVCSARSSSAFDFSGADHCFLGIGSRSSLSRHESITKRMSYFKWTPNNNYRWHLIRKQSDK